MSKQTPCGSRGTRGHPPTVGKGYGYGRGIAWEENGMAMGVGTEESRHRGGLGGYWERGVGKGMTTWS